MKQNERRELEDDLEFEITNLDEADGDAPIAAGSREKPVVFLRKHKGVITIATATLSALALLLILLSIAPVRQFLIPAPVQTTFAYRLDGSPPWGHLFVDGQAVKLASGGVYPLFSLTRGKHSLLWRADPFSPQQCIVMVPVESGIDTCKHPEIPPASGGTDSYISFPTDLALLSREQSTALLEATQAAFDSQQSSEMLRAGDVYAQTGEAVGPNAPSCTVLQIAALCLANAHQPLKATLRMQLDTTSWSRVSCARGACASNGQNCHIFCAPFLYGAAPDGSVSQTVWKANVYAQVFWRFSAADGSVVVDNQADSFIRGQQNDIEVPLNISWDGRRWGVTMRMAGDYAYSGDPVCDAAMRDLNNLENAVPVATGQETQTSMNCIRGTTLASGCLIAFNLQTGDALLTPPPSPAVVAYVMQRFGVLLAVNSAAHHLFPFLPVASAYEKQLAQQWAGHRVMADVQVQVNMRR